MSLDTVLEQRHVVGGQRVIVGAADASHVWDKIVPVQEIVDFFYKTEDGRAVRTSRFLDESTGEIKSVHIHKERQGMCMLDIYGCSSITNAIRVAFNTETEVPLDELPDIRIPFSCTPVGRALSL